MNVIEYTMEKRLNKRLKTGFEKGVDANRNYICAICGSPELTHLTKTSWWTHYSACDSCGEIFEFHHGDNGPDVTYHCTIDDVKEALNGEYKEQMILDIKLDYDE